MKVVPAPPADDATATTGAAMLLAPGTDRFAFHGCVRIAVIHGSISVLGRVVSRDHFAESELRAPNCRQCRVLSIASPLSHAATVVEAVEHLMKTQHNQKDEREEQYSQHSALETPATGNVCKRQAAAVDARAPLVDIPDSIWEVAVALVRTMPNAKTEHQSESVSGQLRQAGQRKLRQDGHDELAGGDALVLDDASARLVGINFMTASPTDDSSACELQQEDVAPLNSAVIVLLPMDAENCFPATVSTFFHVNVAHLQPERVRRILVSDMARCGNLPTFWPLLEPATHSLAILHDIPLVWNQHLPVAFASAMFSERPVVVVTGRVGVGKSSAVRFVINALRNEFAEINLLETDLGQSEMMVPGMVSLHRIGHGDGCAAPELFGAPFTHVDTCPHHCIFVGSTTPKSDIDGMHAAVSDTYAAWETANLAADSLIPLVVNTHGWVTGDGLEVLCDVISIVRPSLVIQIQTPDDTRIDNVGANAWSAIQTAAITARLEHSPMLLVLPSAVQAAVHAQQQRVYDFGLSEQLACLTKRIAPVDTRGLQIETYFMWSGEHASFLRGVAGEIASEDSPNQPSASKRQRSGEPSIKDRSIAWGTIGDWILGQAAYRIPFGSVYAVLLPPHAELVPASQIPRVLNASLVGLCRTPKESSDGHNVMQDKLRVLHVAPEDGNSPTWRCLGLGIVRAVDPVARCFYLTLPAFLQDNRHTIAKNCNSLVRGQLELPASFWRNCQSMAPPMVPYFTSGILARDMFGGSDAAAALAASQPTVRRATARLRRSSGSADRRRTRGSNFQP